MFQPFKTDGRTDSRQTDRQTDTHRQTDRQTDRQTYLLPVSISFEACFSPLGMRSFISCSTIREPMKANSEIRIKPYHIRTVSCTYSGRIVYCHLPVTSFVPLNCLVNGTRHQNDLYYDMFTKSHYGVSVACM